MPTGLRHPIQWVKGGNWENRNETYDPQKHASQLGQKVTLDDRDYMTVRLDSGATSATPTGAQAAQQIAYFKDRAAGLVTNDIRFAARGRNHVAGVFPATVTPDRVTAIYTGRSRNVSMKVDGSAFVAGDQVISDASGAQGTRVAAGTAPTHQLIGYANGAAVANVLAVDLNLPDFD